MRPAVECSEAQMLLSTSAALQRTAQRNVCVYIRTLKLVRLFYACSHNFTFSWIFYHIKSASWQAKTL